MKHRHAAALACARCSEPASMRTVEYVIDGYWTKIRLALCAACDESLRFCDLPWEWFREYTLKGN